jgi:hypothetical protein
LVGEAENIYLFSCPLLHNPDFWIFLVKIE